MSLGSCPWWTSKNLLPPPPNKALFIYKGVIYHPCPRKIIPFRGVDILLPKPTSFFVMSFHDDVRPASKLGRGVASNLTDALWCGSLLQSRCRFCQRSLLRFETALVDGGEVGADRECLNGGWKLEAPIQMAENQWDSHGFHWGEISPLLL